VIATTPASSFGAGRPVRLCLDLNIWVADLLATRAGRTDTACQTLVGAVRRGTCQLGPVQLVMSWAMLTRLRAVLEDKLGLPPRDVELYTAAIRQYAELGPEPAFLLLVLGGTGVVPLKDEEDARVLDTAVAGRADYLATLNLKDFVTYRSRVPKPGRIVLVPYVGESGAHAELVVTDPREIATWARTGQAPAFTQPSK